MLADENQTTRVQTTPPRRPRIRIVEVLMIALGIIMILMAAYLIFQKVKDKATPEPPAGQGDPNFVWVEGGQFIMGIEAGQETDSLPAHPVRVPSFYMSAREVTQAEWMEVTGGNPSQFKHPQNPVEQVDWYDAIRYCNIRSLKEGLTPCYSISGNTSPSSWSSGSIAWNPSADGYRLPTEAEWEFAAKGGMKSSSYLYSGSNEASLVCWYNAESSVPQPVGTKQPNELGIHDMSGNVWEWCWDWFAPYNPEASTHPMGPSSGAMKILRGGSYIYDAGLCRVFFRSYRGPSYKFGNVGFRVCSNRQPQARN